MYYLQWMNGIPLMKSEFIESLTPDGCATWSGIRQAKSFASSEEALAAIKSGEGRMWTGNVKITFIHPLNIQ